jgi:hypothetical protein
MLGWQLVLCCCAACLAEGHGACWWLRRGWASHVVQVDRYLHHGELNGTHLMRVSQISGAR